jgi:hypothetical protein
LIRSFLGGDKQAPAVCLMLDCLTFIVCRKTTLTSITSNKRSDQTSNERSDQTSAAIKPQTSEATKLFPINRF